MREFIDIMELPHGAEIYIYGAGRGGRLIADALWQRADVSILGFIDASRSGTLRGFPIYSLDGSQAARDALIIVASAHWDEISTLLAEKGYVNVWNAATLIELKVESVAFRLPDAHVPPPADRLEAMLRAFVADDAPPQQSSVVAPDRSPGSRTAIEALLECPEQAQEIVAIGYWGRSGSYLLSNLLDGHPEILAVPPHALQWAVHYLVMWFSERDEFSEATTLDAFVPDFIKAFPNLFADSQEPFYQTLIRCGRDREIAPGVDRDAFAANFRSCLQGLHQRGKLTLANMFRAIHVAYAAASGQNLSTEAPIIVWQIHDLRVQHRTLFREILGPIRFILCARYPEKSLDAYLQAHLSRPPYALKLMRVPRNLVRYLLENDHKAAEDEAVSVIRFEDMHNNTEAVMRALALWLGLRWDPCLLETTCDGKIIWFKSGSKYVTGTRPVSRADLAVSQLGPFDRLRLRYLLRDTYRVWYGEDRFRLLSRTGAVARWLEGLAALVPLRFQRLIARHSGARGLVMRLYALAVMVEEARETGRMLRAEARARRSGTTPHPLLPIPGARLKLDE